MANRITSSSPVRPMRAVKVRDKDSHLVRLPVWVGPKFDGWRGIVKSGAVLTNSLLPIENLYVQDYLSDPWYEGLDGELIVRDEAFNQTTSGLASRDGEPDFEFQVFDIWNKPNMPFEDRYTELQMRFAGVNDRRVKIIEQRLCYTWDDVLEAEAEYLEQDYEGICGRYWQAPYKYGRGTFNDGCLFKRKPWEDSEAMIIGFEEQEENLNEATKDERGLSKRSSHQANKIGKGVLGAFICDTKEFGTIRLGTGKGLTPELRKFIWENKPLFENRFCTYKFQRHGTLNKPRIAVLDKESSFEFMRMRDYRDIARD